jgi:hypothetical protein
MNGKRVASCGQESVSYASRGFCFMFVIKRHEQKCNICPSRNKPGKRTRSAARDTTDTKYRCLTFAPLYYIEENPHARKDSSHTRHGRQRRDRNAADGQRTKVPSTRLYSRAVLLSLSSVVHNCYTWNMT